MHSGLSPSIKSIADNSISCLDLAMNFLVSQITSRPPMKVTSRMSLQVSQQQQHVGRQLDSDLSITRTSCLNMLANAFGYIPLEYSTIRADPVLFLDNVSKVRKEYRKLENFWIIYFQILFLALYIIFPTSGIIFITIKILIPCSFIMYLQGILTVAWPVILYWMQLQWNVQEHSTVYLLTCIYFNIFCVWKTKCVLNISIIYSQWELHLQLKLIGITASTESFLLACILRFFQCRSIIMFACIECPVFK